MSNKARVWMGCDIGKETFVAALADVARWDQKWADLPHAEFACSQKGIGELSAWLDKKQLGREQLEGVCIEATSHYSQDWVDWADGRFGPVSVVNPLRPKRHREALQIRGKSDRIDAAACALFGRVHRPEARAPLSAAQRKLREQHRAYLTLEKDRSAYKNRLENTGMDKTVRRVLRATLKTIEKQMSTLQAAMEQAIQEDEALRADVRLARTIPGVAVRVTQAVFSEFGDLRTYTRNQLVSLTGLYPREYSSGTSVYKKPCLAKGGGGRVRKVLYMAALSACTHNPHMRAFSQRLQANGKTPMAAIGAVMRKLLLLIRAVVVSGAPYDPKFGQPV